MRGTRKLCVVALSFLLVVGLSAPSGASGPVSIDGGTLTTVLGNFDLTPGSQGPLPCPSKFSNVYFETRADGTWRLTNGFSRQFQFPAGSGNWYQFDIWFQNGSGGTWSGAYPTYTLAGTLGVRISVYLLQSAGGPLNCLKNNYKCTLWGVFSLAATSTYQSNGLPPGLPNTSIADTITIDASWGWGGWVTAQCTNPWNALGGTVATWTGLQLDM